MNVKRTWVLTDGATGNVKQCLALCHYLGVDPVCFSEKARRPWRIFAPRLVWGSQAALPDKLRQAVRLQQPDLVISAGRQGALLSRMIASLWPRPPFRIQILNPRVPPAHFDLVITPAHDQLSGPNVLETMGSLNNLDDTTLERARSQWAPRLGDLPSPRHVILIGGATRSVDVSPGMIEAMAASASARLEREGGSVLVSLSPRSTPDIYRSVDEFMAPVASDLWRGEPENPYMGYLAYADRITVTPDSVNMVSEACSVGVPVHVDYESVTHSRFSRFYAALAQANQITPPDASGSAGADVRPLRETERIADEVRRRLERR